MWFKNLRVYQLVEPLSHSPEQMNEALAHHAFQPCGSLDPVKYGWTFPLGREGQEYVHVANGYIMICGKRQEKVLPSAVIKEALEEKVLDINNSESRHVGRAERDSLKDEIIFSLMPKALAKSSLDYAYIDTHDNLIVTNAASAKRAEDLLSALREALGSLKVLPLTPQKAPQDIMTYWVTSGETPEDMEVGEECELTGASEGTKVSCKKLDLTCEEVSLHIEKGLRVSKLALTWNEAISCVVDDQFAFKRLSYDDEILDKADDHIAETKAAQFDIEFSIMTLELSAFLRSMIKAFGGAGREHSSAS